jgi:transcriptional regulator with XRE-family HTH domain
VTNDFGRKLRALRRQRGLTQAELGGDEMSTSYVSLLEAGKRRPTVELALRLAARLDIAPTVLLDPADLPVTETASVLDLRYAELALLGGEFDEAFELAGAFRGRVADDSPEWLRASAVMARAKECLGDLEEAASLYREYLDEGRKAPRGVVESSAALAGLGRCLRERGLLATEADRIEQAWEAVRELQLEATPIALELTTHLAAIRREQDDRGADALLTDELVESAGRASSLAATYRNASTLARAAGRFAQALELAECAIAAYRSPSGADALVRVRPAGGADVLEAALEYGSAADIARCEIELSSALLGSDAERAHELATTALTRIGPQFRLSRAEAKSAQGRAAWELGRREEAVRILREAAGELAELGLARLSARVLLDIAGLQEQEGHVADALAAYRQAAVVGGLAASSWLTV